MRYGSIVNSKIVEVVDQEEAPSTPGVWIACGAAGPGWALIEGENFEPPPGPSDDVRITGVAFKRRLSSAERIAIRELAKTNAHVYDYMDLLDSAPAVHLTDADVIGGLHMLESASILAAGRAAAILSAPIQPGERP
jgi:hypothetical protein